MNQTPTSTGPIQIPDQSSDSRYIGKFYKNSSYLKKRTKSHYNLFAAKTNSKLK